MNILLIGSGGREHALAWKIAASPVVKQLFIAPGNAGTSEFGKNFAIAVNDFAAIAGCCLQEDISMVVVGPEEPLVNGIVDYFSQRPELSHIALIGPDAAGAKLEGSKAFAKEFMQRHNIPTATYREFNEVTYEEGIAYLSQHKLPVVLKADGLAAGKGVLICQTYDEALDGFALMLKDRKFGEAGAKVVVEEFLDGIELSVFILTDGNNYVILPEAKDYKRIGEADTGNNTGGMGAISPVPFANNAFMEKVEQKIIAPTVAGLKRENIDYRGFIFFGLIKVGGEPYVIEYNCRMGDPETEVVMLRLQNDLVELFQATVSRQLGNIAIHSDPRAAAAVVAVSGGYPEAYQKGFVIDGLQQEFAESIIFHSGTVQRDADVVSAGGRVLCVSSYGNSVTEAAENSVSALEKISFEGMYFRRDIGYEFQ